MPLRIFATALIMLVGSCQISAAQQVSDIVAHEDLDALLWVRTSAEYESITRQTFQLAKMNLGAALVDPAWTASTEQAAMFADSPQALAALKPAIIVDVDETVLDNSAYQVALIESGDEFSSESWQAFCREEVSLAIPGATEFMAACRAAGVAVLFVTNREYAVEEATRSNLIKAGLLQQGGEDLIFTKYEQEDWTSNKQTRREYLSQHYRILLLLGDDLNDFIDAGRHPESDQRRWLANEFAGMWGQRWIVLPNPNYGGWERAVYDWQDSSLRETKLKLKTAAMRGKK